MNEILLGINIDHIATIRNARGTDYPDPVHAAAVAEFAGADGITVHLREDRRHITDRDVSLLRQTLKTRMNLEMAVTEEMLQIAERIQPEYCCLVPEKREELTTEGGLDVASNLQKIKLACARLATGGTKVSLFIDPDEKQIDAAVACKVPYIEIHTGSYAEAATAEIQAQELRKIIDSVNYAADAGLAVNAGHGLHYNNVKPIAAIPQIYELNIGHSVIARAAIDGLEKAVKDMKQLLKEARD